VIIGSAPAAFVSAMNVSASSPAVALSLQRLWKYQSCAWFETLSCQL